MIVDMILTFCAMFVPAFLVYKFFSFVNKKYKLDNKPYEFSASEEIGKDSIAETDRKWLAMSCKEFDFERFYHSHD